MHFALIDNDRFEATPELKGKTAVCPVCGASVIAKCGNLKIWHWAHKPNEQCDTWQEHETEWHLMWKNYFAKDCQEIVFTDANTGEKHIADVCLDGKYIIEFQHSAISETERTAREKFYTQDGRNMIWVVDGTRCPSEYKKFVRELNYLERSVWEGINDMAFAFFPKRWKTSRVIVAYDFKGMLDEVGDGDYRNSIYCLLPSIPKSFYFPNAEYFIPIEREKFINLIRTGMLYQYINNVWNEFKKAERIKQIRYNLEYAQWWARTNPRHNYSRRKRRL